MPPVGFEPTISAGERPQTYALDRLGPPIMEYGTGKKGRTVRVHSLKLHGCVEVQFLSLLTSNLGDYEWLATGPGRITPGKMPPVPIE
jgi:hypothetical protein